MYLSVVDQENGAPVSIKVEGIPRFLVYHVGLSVQGSSMANAANSWVLVYTRASFFEQMVGGDVIFGEKKDS